MLALLGEGSSSGGARCEEGREDLEDIVGIVNGEREGLAWVGRRHTQSSSVTKLHHTKTLTVSRTSTVAKFVHTRKFIVSVI